MKIYYFGELIENTNVPKTETKIQQTELDFEQAEVKKTGMESIGDLLRDIDLNLDVYRPMNFGQHKASQL